MKVLIEEVIRSRGYNSLYSFAKKIDKPIQTVISWASGKSQPGYENIDLLCSELNCTPNDLFVPEF